MSDEDREVMSRTVELHPYFIDLYWVSWELTSQEGAQVIAPGESTWSSTGSVELNAQVHAKCLVESGWTLPEGCKFPTFTTSRPRSSPGRRPAGLDRCAEHEKKRWLDDQHRFAPYQYRDHQLLWNKAGAGRLPNISEREACMGIPVGYTRPCVGKQDQKLE